MFHPFLVAAYVVQDIVSTASRGWDAVAVVPALRHLGLCVVTPPLLPVHPGPPPTAGTGPAKGAHVPKKPSGDPAICARLHAVESWAGWWVWALLAKSCGRGWDGDTGKRIYF